MPSFGKRTPFSDSHLAPFEAVYDPVGRDLSRQQDIASTLAARTQGEYSFGAEQIAVDKQAAVENENVDDKLLHSRWRCFSREWIANTKGDSLDISWLKTKTASMRLICLSLLYWQGKPKTNWQRLWVSWMNCWRRWKGRIDERG